MNEMVEAMMSKGISRADAMMVVDLINFSISEAMQAMERVAEAAPTHLYPHVATISALMLERHLHGINNNVMEFLADSARRHANG